MAAALSFLEFNGIAAQYDWTKLYMAMIAIAEKRMDKAGLAALLRERFTRQGGP